MGAVTAVTAVTTVTVVCTEMGCQRHGMRTSVQLSELGAAVVLKPQILCALCGNEMAEVESQPRLPFAAPPLPPQQPQLWKVN